MSVKGDTCVLLGVKGLKYTWTCISRSFECVVISTDKWDVISNTLYFLTIYKLLFQLKKQCLIKLNLN